MKRCSRCGESKPLDAFSRNKRSGDGRVARCKDCQRAYRAENAEVLRERDRRYRAGNAEAIAERKRAWYQANREAIAAKDRAYQQANAEAIAEYQRGYRAANREAMRGYGRAYHAANPHVAWEAKYRDRAARYGFVPVVERFTRADLVARYGDRCWHCGGDFEELDHYPLAVRDGGPHALDNVRPSCTPCNRGRNQAVA